MIQEHSQIDKEKERAKTFVYTLAFELGLQHPLSLRFGDPAFQFRDPLLPSVLFIFLLLCNCILLLLLAAGTVVVFIEAERFEAEQFADAVGLVDAAGDLSVGFGDGGFGDEDFIGFAAFGRRHGLSQV